MRLSVKKDESRSNNTLDIKDKKYNDSKTEYDEKNIKEKDDIVRKKVSRYSEKRSNRAKEKELKAETAENKIKEVEKTTG